VIKTYVATIQVLVAAGSQGGACDGISETLSNYHEEKFIIDWAYLKIGAQRLCPTQVYVNLEDYEEGDFLTDGYAL